MIEDLLWPILQVLFLLTVITVVIKLVRGWLPSQAYGHWKHMADDFSYSSQDFYEKLKASLMQAGIAGLHMKIVYIAEGAIFVSPKRAYLRVTWKDKVMDICAAPYGKGFFFSWWLFEKDKFWKIIVLSIPYLGKYIVNLIDPMTYYKIDTANMFQSYVHTYVTGLVEEITKEKGSQGLTHEQKRPIMNDIFLNKR
jgi:hypothetical protein